jgi:hypothetical protein
LTNEAFQIFVKELGPEEKIDRDDLRYFLDKVIVSGNQLHKAAMRGIVLVAALAGLFVLMSAGGLTEAEVFGVKVSRFSLFLIFIPVAIAFVFARSVILLKSSIIYKDVFYKITARYYPAWSRSALDGLLNSGSFMLSSAVHEGFFKPGVGRRVLELSAAAERAVWALAPAAFDVYAYIVLFRSPEIQPVGVVLSLVTATLLMLVGWINLVTMSLRDDSVA